MIKTTRKGLSPSRPAIAPNRGHAAVRRVSAWIAVVSVSALVLGACGESTTAVSRSASVQQIYADDIHIVGDLSKTAKGLYSARWSGQPVYVSASGPLWEAAAKRWQPAVRIVHNKNGRIRFGGFTHRPVCGYAVPYIKKGEIRRCDIFLNKALADDTAICGGSEIVLAHEIGHCLGIIGHTKDGGLMDSHAGNKQPSIASLEGLRALYARPFP
jgi:hypothetical protein